MRALMWVPCPGSRGLGPKALLTLVVTLLVLAGAAEAFAGSVSRTAAGILYTGAGGNEEVDLVSEGGVLVVRSARGAATSDCAAVSATEAACSG